MPAAPAGLTANVLGSSVTLQWQAPGAGLPFSGYVVEVGSSAGRRNIGSFPLGSGATTFSATNVAPGTYYVRIRAVGAAGIGPPSNELALVVTAAP